LAREVAPVNACRHERSPSRVENGPDGQRERTDLLVEAIHARAEPSELRFDRSPTFSVGGGAAALESLQAESKLRLLEFHARFVRH
jgi:hypothetical protein